jgi:hypothetical protein
VKGIRVVVSAFVFAFIMGFPLALLSRYMVAHSEQRISESTRLTMIFGMSRILAAMAAVRGANRR